MRLDVGPGSRSGPTKASTTRHRGHMDVKRRVFTSGLAHIRR